jgi:hypothetical protein
MSKIRIAVALAFGLIARRQSLCGIDFSSCLVTALDVAVPECV